MSTDVSEVRAASIIVLMMEAVRTSETSVDNYFTRQYIPEDNSELHTRCLENLKSHKGTIGYDNLTVRTAPPEDEVTTANTHFGKIKSTNRIKTKEYIF
jgi:hypothetical protein